MPDILPLIQQLFSSLIVKVFALISNLEVLFRNSADCLLAAVRTLFLARQGALQPLQALLCFPVVLRDSELFTVTVSQKRLQPHVDADGVAHRGPF